MLATVWTRVNESLVAQVFALNMFPKPGPVLGRPHADPTLPKVSTLDHLLFNQTLYLLTKKNNQWNVDLFLQKSLFCL